MSNATFEIIKMDAELSECPETGIRYFGYAKIHNENKNITPHWEPVWTGYGDLPWFLSQEELIEHSKKFYKDSESITQLIILKAEVPIKKLVL